MGRKDITSINYFKDKSRIADLLNVYLYQGQEVIKEKDITELNPILAKSWWNNKDLKSNVNTLNPASVKRRGKSSWYHSF